MEMSTKSFVSEVFSEAFFRERSLNGSPCSRPKCIGLADFSHLPCFHTATHGSGVKSYNTGNYSRPHRL